jgi:Flp pilus assembly protein CpaB
MSGKSSNPLAKLFAGKRAGTILMACGALLAAGAFVMVLGMARRSAAAATQVVPQVYVVTAARDIPQFTAINADALAIKAFPKAFAPAGAPSRIEDVAGKFAATTIARDQIILGSQVSDTRRTSNISATVPPGKVAFWMPLPDLLVQSGGLQPGDHVDVLLSLELTRATVGGIAGLSGTESEEITSVSTQTTLQNVEVYFAGAAANADLPDGVAPTADAKTTSRATSTKVVAFLLDPQDAVLAKWVKDSGGVIDLVLRSDADKDAHATESVNADTVIEGFKFRIPEQWSLRKR